MILSCLAAVVQQEEDAVLPAAVCPADAETMVLVGSEAAISSMYLTGWLICNFPEDKKPLIVWRFVLKTRAKNFTATTILFLSKQAMWWQWRLLPVTT